MKTSHILVAVLVVAIWGINFVAIKVGTEFVPPIFLAGLRMFLTGFPLILFLKKPSTSWKWIVAYGLSIFSLNFGFLFVGMKLGVSAGLTSLIFQTQVFFTIGLSAIIFKERIRPIQSLFAVIAFAGLIIIAINRGGSITAAGLLCVLLACLSWAVGNIVSKKIGKVQLLRLVVWSGFISSIPLFIFSYFMEGTTPYHLNWTELPGQLFVSIAFLVYPTTILGFALWSWLLNLYRAPTLLPCTLMVPIFGIFAGAFILDERFEQNQIIGIALVFFGVTLNVLFSPKRLK